MARIVIRKPENVFARPDGRALCVPIVAYPERTAKIAPNYVSALTMAVVTTLRASVCARQALRATNVSIPARTTCTDSIVARPVVAKTGQLATFPADFAAVTRAGSD